MPLEGSNSGKHARTPLLVREILTKRPTRDSFAISEPGKSFFSDSELISDIDQGLSSENSVFLSEKVEIRGTSGKCEKSRIYSRCLRPQRAHSFTHTRISKCGSKLEAIGHERSKCNRCVWPHCACISCRAIQSCPKYAHSKPRRGLLTSWAVEVDTDNYVVPYHTSNIILRSVTLSQ